MSYIKLLVSETVLEKCCPELLLESQWKASGISDLYIRIDPPRPEMYQRRHVHIAHKKHVSSTDKQVSWNDDGTRHDSGRFNDGFNGIEKAKAAARIALNLGDDAVLESMGQQSRFEKVINEDYDLINNMGVNLLPEHSLQDKCK